MQEEFITKELHEAQIDTVLIAVDGINNRVDDLKDSTEARISDLKDSVNRSLTLFTIVFAAMQFGLAVMLYYLSKLIH